MLWQTWWKTLYYRWFRSNEFFSQLLIIELYLIQSYDTYTTELVNSTHLGYICYALDSLINIMYFDPGHEIKKSSTKGNGASSKNGKVYISYLYPIQLYNTYTINYKYKMSNQTKNFLLRVPHCSSIPLLDGWHGWFTWRNNM